MKTVVVIGGGVAGLSAAESLRGRANVIVLDEAAAPGGKIQTRHVSGFVVETGPHGFLDKEPAVMKLIDDLGLSSELISADESAAKRFVVRDQTLRLLPANPPAFLKSDVLPLGAKLRVLLEPFISRGHGEETVWDFAKRRLGRGAADVLVDAFVTGIYGGDPKALSLEAAFPRLAELEREFGSLIRAQIKLRSKSIGALHSFRRGLVTLVTRLAERTRVVSNYRVERVEVGARFRIEGSGGPVDADAVIFAVPAFEAARLLGSYVPAQAQSIAEIPYVPVSVVVQAFRQDEVGGDFRGFGFLVPGPENREILGSIYASSVFRAHAPEKMVMLRTIIGGARRPELAIGDDSTLAERARRELVALARLNPSAQPVITEVIRWPCAIPQYALGHAARVEAANSIEREIPGVFLIGNAFRGVSMIASMADGLRVGIDVERWLHRPTPSVISAVSSNT